MNRDLKLAGSKKAAVVIPAFEPPKTLISLVENLSTLPVEVIIVDDGSQTDCTEVWTQTASHAVILHHPENRGKGAALKTTFLYIRDQLPKVQIIVTMDADGQHLISDMINVVNAAYSPPSPGAKCRIHRQAFALLTEACLITCFRKKGNAMNTK